MIHILHLSDIHVSTLAEAGKYRTQLETDLKNELNVKQLDYLVVSGDIAERSTPDEYKAAYELADGIIKRFRLDPGRVVVAPGNHDLNWDLSAEAYTYVPRHKLPDPLTDEFIPAGDAGALKRDEEGYKKRFENFSKHFYKEIYGEEYPADYSKQGILTIQPDEKILFLALNSCWNTDHHFTGRAGINMEALTHALDQMAQGNYDGWLKIAVWHHPVSGKQMINNEFLELLTVRGFQICMHGHIHEAQEGFYKYDAGRGIHIVGAGTFGAPAKEQVPGIPLQYNLLAYDPDAQVITVETRKKEKPDGAWSADARWGDKNDPKPRYVIELGRADSRQAEVITGNTEIGFDQKSELTDALLACSSVSNRGSRDTVVSNLPDDVKNAIQRDNAAMIDVMGIVSSCLDHPGGINELIKIVRHFEGGSVGRRNLDDLIRRLNLE